MPASFGRSRHLEGQEGSATYCTSLNSAECPKQGLSHKKPASLGFLPGMIFPFQLAHVFSVAFEEELSTEWNSRIPKHRSKTPGANREAFRRVYRGMLLKIPELIENEQGLHTVTSSQAGGWGRHERVRSQIFTTKRINCI